MPVPAPLLTAEEQLNKATLLSQRLYSIYIDQGGKDGEGYDCGDTVGVVQAELCRLLSAADAARLLDFIIASVGMDGEKVSNDVLFLDAPEDKADRGKLHGLVRENWGRLVDTKTEAAPDGGSGSGGAGGGSIKVWHQDSNSGVSGVKGRAGRRRWSPGSPEYVRFILEKEGTTTLDAIGLLAKALRCKRERFEFAGAKVNDWAIYRHCFH